MSTFTGYAIEKEDRDELNRTSTSAEMLVTGDLPDRVDPRRHKLAKDGWLQVENQGQIGSCQGQSLTECAEYCYAVATGLVIQFSRMFAYLVSQMANNIRSDSGSTLSGGTKCVRETGLCKESDGPYPSRYPGWSWVTDKMRSLAKSFKLRTHTVMKSAEEIRRFIGSGVGIVQIGIRWGNAMQPDSHGCIRRWSYSSRDGGHAVVFCGYVPDSDIGQKSTQGYWLLLKNSWSKRWGKDGYAYVDPAAVDQMLRDKFTTMIGRSDMESPSPRPLPIDFTKPGESAYA